MNAIFGGVADKTLSERGLCDVELILNGAFAPLDGFLRDEDYRSVLESMRLADGALWPIPVTLTLSDAERRTLRGAERLRLRDGEGRAVAELEIETLDPFDASAEARAVFGADDPAHPFVRLLRSEDGGWRVGGRLRALDGVRRPDFAHLRRDPAETRAMIKRAGWSSVVAFQTRNPLHRSHFHLTLNALDHVGPGAGLMLHPAVGPTQPGDIDASVRVGAYERILHRYPAGRAALALLPLSMRMAGPREALWHAIVRKNHGATHFIVGRDHAGPSAKRADGSDFFDPYAAQTLVARHADEIGITPVFSRAIAYYPDLDAYLPVDQAPEDARAMALSGTRQRELLAAGEPLPEWFSFPEVAELLVASTKKTSAAA